MMVIIFKIRFPCKWARETFSKGYVWIGTLTLIHGTFFESIVCVAVSRQMYEHWDKFNRSDHVSIVAGMIYYGFLIGYLLFGFYFVFFKSGKLALKTRTEIEEENLKRCVFLHESLVFQQKHKGQSDA